MNITLEELENKPYSEIVGRLTELAPRVLEAHGHYKALAAEQRLYVAVQLLRGAGVRTGDRVQMRGNWAGKKDPLAIVVGTDSRDVLFQVLRKDGQPHGEPQPGWMFSGFDKLD